MKHFIRSYSDVKLRANVVDKPNHIWPSNVQPPIAQQDPAFKSPRFYENMTHISKPQNDPLHPYSVRPPVKDG